VGFLVLENLIHNLDIPAYVGFAEFGYSPVGEFLMLAPSRFVRLCKPCIGWKPWLIWRNMHKDIRVNQLICL
ncbi:MAG: hypothetical protein AAB942_00095, partial [Patescibacteria group bacterium]